MRTHAAIGAPHEGYWALFMVALAIAACLRPGLAAAEATLASPHGVTLIVPEPLRDLLESNFAPPPARLPDATAVAQFVRRAQREIPELLATEGYFSPRVEVQRETYDERGGKVTLLVTPGERTTVEQVLIDFFGDLAAEEPGKRERAEQLRAGWSLPEGRPFRARDWEDAKAALLATVSQRDYRRAEIVDSIAEVDPASAKARLWVVIDSGPPFRFGELSISGLRLYDEAVIRAQATFRPGEPYRQDKLLAYQAKLQNMPQFSAVTISMDPDTQRPDQAPVRVLLSEAKPHQVAFGLGFSTNTGARGEINYRNLNFYDRPWTFSSSLHVEEKRQTLAAGIDTAPKAKGERLAWSARVEATDIQGLETVRQALGVARVQATGRIERRIGIDFQREARRPEGGVQETQRALVLDWGWIRRAVDNPLLPRRGDIIELRLGGAKERILSSQDFLRGWARYQRWWPIGRRDALSLRAEGGLTLAPSRFGIPQEYLFRAGGAQSVRGYAYNSLGVQEGDAIVGGRALLTGSLEYTHWFTANWGAALFYDVGDATDDRRDLDLESGYGLGARWRSPAGPLGIDFAYGEQTRTWRVHFAISVGF